MPNQQYIDYKASGCTSSGSWFKGTLHFGIELHRIIQLCDDNLEIYPDTTEANQIDWNTFVSEMEHKANLQR